MRQSHPSLSAPHTMFVTEILNGVRSGVSVTCEQDRSGRCASALAIVGGYAVQGEVHSGQCETAA